VRRRVFNELFSSSRNAREMPLAFGARDASYGALAHNSIAFFSLPTGPAQRLLPKELPVYESFLLQLRDLKCVALGDEGIDLGRP